MTEDLSKVVEALKQESISLKGVIEQLGAQKDALSGTVNEILQANVNLRANNILLEKNIMILKQDIADKAKQLADLSANKLDTNKAK